MGLLTNWYGAKFLTLLTAKFSDKSWKELGVNDDGTLKSGKIDLLFNICRKIKLVLRDKFKIGDNKIAMAFVSLYMLKDDVSGSAIPYSEFSQYLEETLEQPERVILSELADIYEELGAKILDAEPNFFPLVKSIMETPEEVHKTTKIMSFKEFLEEKETTNG